jgi:16S rRNA (uracil1498-N3)-methyltransferase
MHRFFLSPDTFVGDEIQITEPGLNHRLRNVLRLQIDDRIICLDNTNWEYEVVLRRVDPELIVGEILQKHLCTSEPRVKITLYQAVLKGDRFELVLQKGTEVGISEFVPLLSERCIVVNAQQLSEQKMRRWDRIVQQAAEQSRRGRLPPLQPLMLFSAACERVKRSGGLALIPWAEEATPLEEVLEQAGRTQRPFNVSLFIGPEGGFSSPEVRMARDYGVVPVSLGPRILRAETASIVASALVLYTYGDMTR